MAETFASIDEYIASFPDEVQEVLEKVRATMHEAAPGSGEKISYQIPTITLDGSSLVYFAGWQKHVSVYPLPDGLDATTSSELAPYTSGASTAKFLLKDPIPYELIGKLTAAHAESRRRP